MERTFIVESFNPDSHGDVIMPGAFKDLPKKVLLTKNFDLSHPIGEGEVMLKGNNLIAQGDIPSCFDNFYPAIGFQILEQKEGNGINIITNCKLHYVGLSVSNNVDANIKMISKQI
jgi:hypothetical protein